MFNNVKMPINADAIDSRRQTSSLGFTKIRFKSVINCMQRISKDMHAVFIDFYSMDCSYTMKNSDM